jgi:hypothetical protein
MGKHKSIVTLCETCQVRPWGAGGKLSRCLECLKTLVERDKRLRAERAALRNTKIIRARLAATKSGGKKGASNFHMISINLGR